MYGRVSNNYTRVAVETADQKTLILICYDEALRSLRLGKEFYLKKQFQEKGHQFNRALDFISELESSLNLEAGGEIANFLKNIYQFVSREILQADLTGDMKRIDNLTAMLSELRSAWAEIDTRPSAGVVPIQPYGQVAMAARGFAV
jgi:flagellar protein FliS